MGFFFADLYRIPSYLCYYWNELKGCRMKLGFDSEKYLEEQSQFILQRVNAYDKYI